MPLVRSPDLLLGGRHFAADRTSGAVMRSYRVDGPFVHFPDLLLGAGFVAD
jgi:hypothetical protein